MTETKQFPPQMKVQFIPDIEETGATKGFITIKKNSKNRMEAKYNNIAKVTFDSTDILVSNNGEPRAIPYSQYRKNPDDYPNVKVGPYGLVAWLRLKDAEKGHEMTWFANASNDNPRMLNWVAEKITDLVEKYEITDDNKDELVFEMGKEESAKGTMGRWYFKYIGRADELELVTDPNGAARKEKILEEQAPAQEVETIENFTLTEDEEFIMGQLNTVVSAKNLTVSRARIKEVFVTGFKGKKSKPARAAYIAAKAEDFGFNGKISGDE